MNARGWEIFAVTAVGPERFPCVPLYQPAGQLVLPLWVSEDQARELRKLLEGVSPGHTHRTKCYSRTTHSTDVGVADVSLVYACDGLISARITMFDGTTKDVRASDACVIAVEHGLALGVASEVVHDYAVPARLEDVASYLGASRFLL